MANFSLVACAEVHGTRKENKTVDDWTASVDLRCDYADRYNLVDDILGLQRPWPYWPYVGGIGMYPRSAAIKAEPTEYVQNEQGMDYQKAVLSVTYGLPGRAGQPDPTTLVSESLEPTSTFLTQEHTDFKWKSDDAPLTEGEAPGRPLRGMRLVRTLYKLASVNANILTLPDSCNDVEYTSALLGITFPAQTLRFIPPNLSRTITTDGVGAWNVRVGWEYKEGGWNTFWRKAKAGGPGDDSIVVESSGADYNQYVPLDQSPWLA